MATTLNEVRELALTLNAQDREILAQELVSSLDYAHLSETQKAWFQETERRYRDLKSGKTKGISAEEVFAELRQTHY